MRNATFSYKRENKEIIEQALTNMSFLFDAWYSQPTFLIKEDFAGLNYDEERFEIEIEYEREDKNEKLENEDFEIIIDAFDFYMEGFLFGYNLSKNHKTKL